MICKPPCTNELRHRVTFQTRTDTVDNLGGSVTTWADEFDAWVRIEPTSGRQSVFAGKIQNPVTHKITMRYLADVTPKQRVLFGTRTFDIQSIINPEERNIALVLMVEEGTGT